MAYDCPPGGWGGQCQLKGDTANAGVAAGIPQPWEQGSTGCAVWNHSDRASAHT